MSDCNAEGHCHAQQAYGSYTSDMTMAFQSMRPTESTWAPTCGVTSIAIIAFIIHMSRGTWAHTCRLSWFGAQIKQRLGY